MARNNTIRLLLINASDNDSEHLVSLFRSAGRVARAHRIDSADELENALQQTWDLLIADDHHPELKVETCLEHLRAADVDFPVLVLRDTTEVSALFAAGAHDVIAPNDEQRLVCAALREINDAELRRSLGKLQKQLQEAEDRNALLLGEADQAIAYVADGMVIGANALFAERFGYADADELDCVPIVDLVTADDQEGFKAALKNGSASEFSCSGQRADGETFQSSLRLVSSTYDGDPCTQLIIEDRQAAAAVGNKDYDADTGLHSRTYLREQLGKRNGGWLLCIGIDHFAALRTEIGYSKSCELIAHIARFLSEKNPLPQGGLARIGDDSFALLADNIKSERVLELAQQLCAAVADHNFGSDGKTQACTISIGIAAIQGDADSVLDRAFNIAEQARAAGDGNNALVQQQESETSKRVTPQQGESSALEEALESQRFALLYQPIISLRGAAGEHYEVLLRMRGDTDTLELPDNFLESLGVSASNAKLDRWILLEATKQLAANRAKGNDTRLLINLTANALQDETLINWLGIALKAGGLPANALILQLHESDVINDLKAAKTFADAIRQLGCRFAIGGFGRVLDPLKTLKSVSADIVQVDGSFTRTLLSSGDAQPLKGLVSALGGSSTNVIIPFVENASVLATLWQVGADFIQGHYLQAPSREMNYEFTDIA